jgi:hypothetical protein
MLLKAYCLYERHAYLLLMCAPAVKDGRYYPVGQCPIPKGPYQSDQGPFYANGTPAPANVVNNSNQNNNANSNNNQGEPLQPMFLLFVHRPSAMGTAVQSAPGCYGVILL